MRTVDLQTGEGVICGPKKLPTMAANLWVKCGLHICGPDGSWKSDGWHHQCRRNDVNVVTMTSTSR